MPVPPATDAGGADGSQGVEDNLPDFLKNTPSNIARLEDEIERFEGRQKYLAQTRSASDGGDVRWYFCKVPLAENELAASVPRSEIVGKSDYFRFGMRDSLAIEASFLQREEELLSAWWKEYAECSEGPRERPSSSKNIKQTMPLLEGAESAELCDFEEERVGVPVKGGLYEVDLTKRHSFPVYWNGDNRRVLRGHWFARKGGLDWLPIREDVAEQLEIAYRRRVWHRRTFQPSGLFAAQVDLQGSSSTLGLHALFTGEDDTWEAWLNVDASGFSSVVNFSGNGIKLRRGYSPSLSPKPTQEELRQQKEEEMDDYCSQVPVRHLVFMVHGIGQRLEKSNLVDDVGNFRHITASLAERHLTSYQRGTQRVLYIPCQWRKGLKLSGETAVEKITLDGVRGLRVMLSATVHDVLYYMSPIYCQDIIDSVSNQLNRLYLKFLKRNPGYDGKVSIYGHSLGSVLSYDILCHQEVLSSPFPVDWMYKEHVRNEGLAADVNNSSNSTVVGETENTEDAIDENKMNAHPTVVKSEDVHAHSSSATARPTESISDELGPRAMDPEQPNAQEAIHDLVSSNMVSLKNSLDDMSELNCAVNIGALEVEEVCGDANFKEKTIISLKEEIDCLKAKIAEMELQCSVKDASGGCDQGNENKDVNMPKQAKSETLPPDQDGGPKSYTPYINYTKLEFKVDTFFAVGSPLGVFLALRNIRLGIGKGQEYWEENNIREEMPACRQMFNIFHPYDPVAYRIEPLVCKEYLSKRPVIIPYHKGGRRLHIGFQEFAQNLAVRSQSVVDQLNSVRVKVLTVCQSRNADRFDEGTENVQQKEEISYGSLMMVRLTGGEGRIDHMLQDKTFEHPYLQAIGAHTNYWRDYDTALFMLKHLYRDIPEDPNISPGEYNGHNSRDESGSTSRETPEEETPLTFSDRTMVRNFSQKARKFMRKS